MAPKFSFLFACAVICCFALLARGQKVGGKLTLTAEGVNHIASESLPALIAQLKQQKIPDQSGRADTPIGHVDWTLTSITIQSLNMGSVTVAFSSPSNLVLSVNGLTVSLHADWSYDHHSFPHISDHGSADISISDSTAQVTCAFSIDGTQHPHIDVTQSTVSLNHFDIDLHGGASWLYNLFLGLFEDSLKDSIQGTISSTIKNSVDTSVNQLLSTFQTSITLDDYSSLAFNFTAPIAAVSSDQLVFSVLGEFYSRTNPQEYSGTPGPLPSSVLTAGSQLQIALSDFIINSASSVYFQAGQLAINITQDQVPPSVPFKLNTTTFALLIPELYNAFPKRGMMLAVTARGPPGVKFVANTGLAALAQAEVVFYVQNNVTGAYDVPALDFELDVNASALCGISSQNLTFNATVGSIDFKLLKSYVGPIASSEIAGLTDIMTVLVSTMVKVVVNDRYGKQGFPIPMVDGVQLTNSVISYGTGFVAIQTDIDWTPTVTAPRLADNTASTRETVHLRGNVQ